MERSGGSEDRLAVALDTGNWEEFQHWCSLFGPRVGVLKVGLQAFVTWGPRAVECARREARRVFLDLKLHDIPNTGAGAVTAARDLGVGLLTLHVAGGREMLTAAREAAADDLGLLGVTVLTHLDESALAELGLPGEVSARVLQWAELSAGCRLAGLVCSPQELPTLRARFAAPFELVTPGIRPAGVERGDQRRTSTPAAALQAGADLLVIGRPLTRASDPVAALEEILRELAEAA